MPVIRRTGQTSIAGWLFIVVALAATLAVAVVMFRVVPAALVPVSAATAETAEAAAPAGPGVYARIEGGGVQVARQLPALSFTLAPGQVLDPRLPAGPFKAEFVVCFDPGRVRRARLGAEVDGGTLSIERRGKVLLTTGGDGRGTAMTGPVFLPGREVTFTYRLRSSGDGPVRLRALWRPDDAMVDLPLPSAGRGLFGGPADAGYALVRQLNCVACHRSGDDALQARLAVSPAPRLGEVGARVRAGWLRRWLAYPWTVKPGAAMPSLFHGVEGGGEAIEDLTHFLVSLGGPIAGDDEPVAPALADTGARFYHAVGCVACHGPLDRPDLPPDRQWIAHGPLAEKTSVAALAAFLKDPVHVRPSGRMPAMALTDLEALALAAFLVRHDRAASGTTVAEAFTPDPGRVRRGREHFAQRGCANCHEMGAAAPPIASTLQARPLESLGVAPAGCLAVEPPAGVPAFGLDTDQRGAIAAFLEQLAAWRTPDAPLLDLAADLHRFNCTGCHTYHGVGGPLDGVDRYFTTEGEVDLGDEGRLPPPLGGVGGRLNPAWLDAVLCEGGVARPYMSTRMPQFGADNVGGLGPLLTAAAGMPAMRDPHDDGPSITDRTAEIGRRLAGEDGFNCIQCHPIAGRASTDLPGPDLVDMPERLRFGYFSRWLHDPKRLRPGTRMPTFFYAGRSGLPELDGDADAQIGAVWGYLSQGEHLALPDGLLDPGDFQVEVLDEPIVMRTFMKEAGSRAIACGFPEHIHYAFDADRCRLVKVWTGRFLNAAGAWAARGGTETEPDQPPVWVDPDTDAVRADATAAAEPSARFRGYRLDSDRRPTFHYEFPAGDDVVQVRESPVPVWDGDRPSLQRRFELRGPPGRPFVVQAAGHRLLDTGEAVDEPVTRRLDDNGTARFILELTW